MTPGDPPILGPFFPWRIGSAGAWSWVIAGRFHWILDWTPRSYESARQRADELNAFGV